MELCERRKLIANKTASGIQEPDRVQKDEMKKRTGGESPDVRTVPDPD
jgi:hypothetical protein